MSLIDSRVIGSKSVFIFHSHHHALLPWSWIRRKQKAAPYLLTLDHHTDTHEPFLSYRFGGGWEKPDDFEDSLRELIAQIDWNNDDSLIKAISKLKFDEHIDTAIQAGILQYAFAINLSNQTPSIEEEARSKQISINWEKARAGKALLESIPYPTRPFSYDIPSNGIFEISSKCAIGCNKMPHDDDCLIARNNEVLESYYLNHELDQANEMAKCVNVVSVEDVPYILDIDLDYFHSERAVSPDDASTFYRLIRGAIAITIALEHSCVEDLKEEGSGINSDYLLEKVLGHIYSATRVV